jgi:protein SCO1
VVRGLDPSGAAVIVEHEDIPGFMPSMTMPFTAKNPQEIAEVRVGDAIVFKFVVTADDAWMEEVRSIAAEDVHLPERPERRSQAAKKASRVHEGDKLPAFRLVDQGNREITPETFAQKALLVTFIFTRCPVPNFCPLVSRNFEAIEAVIRKDPVLADQVRLLSISFDTEFDTPEILAKYGRTFTEDFDLWSFATGAPGEIEALTKAFAVYVKSEQGTLDHGLCTVLVGPDGTVRKIWRGNGWRPEEVIAAVRALGAESGKTEANHDPDQSLHRSDLKNSVHETKNTSHET